MALDNFDEGRAYNDTDESESELVHSKEHDINAWKARNDLGPEMEKKKEELVDNLKDFQRATGIDEGKYIKQLEKCKSKSQLLALEKRFKKAGIKWYETQMRKSGIFEPLDMREEKDLNQEFDGLMEWFKKLPLYGDTSMISTLSTLEKNLEVKRAFRAKLKKQSKFIQGEYFRRLGSLGLVGSREQLLNEILKELKDVEDAPDAVQYEFKKKQKGAGKGKKTAEIKKEVMDEYGKRHDRYKKALLDNKQYFGGDLVVTPFGKLPEAAWEFLEWFGERENFAEMDGALKKLPGLIQQRKKLYDKRDRILKDALPKDREKIEEKTNKMRRHELEAFLPELEIEIRNKNVHTAEFMATILSARTFNIDLYQPLEKTLQIRKFKLADVETQKAKLLVLREEIADRERTVKQYFALPSYLRKDDKFLRANAIEREQMLFDAKEQARREQLEPFDTSHIDHLNSEAVQETEKKLKGEKGEAVMEDIVEEMSQEGALEAAQIQEDTYRKIFGMAKRAEVHEETQKESYLRDLKYWVRMRQNIQSEKDVNTERERSKWRYIQAADEAYDLGYTMTSGGEVRHLEEIDTDELKRGGSRTQEKLQRARYGEHVMVKDHEGKMAEDPLEVIERLSQQELLKLVLIAINKLGRNHMHLGEGNMSILKNSHNIQKELATRIIDMEMSHLDMDPANNSEHFANKVAA